MISRQVIEEAVYEAVWGIPEDRLHPRKKRDKPLADRVVDELIDAGVDVACALPGLAVLTMPARLRRLNNPPAVCGASALIAGIEYVCDQPTHRPGTVHQCTDGIGVMVWRDGDDGPEVVAAWTHEGSDGWPVRPARPWRKRCEGDADEERRCCLTEGHAGECR